VLAPVLENKAEPKRIVFASTLLIGHFVSSMAAAIVFGFFYRGVVNVRMDMYDQVRARGLHNAVVIVHSGGGAYMPFTPKDLTRNGIEIGDQDVIYALDIPGRVSELGQMFPGRALYIYSRKTITASDGVLAPLAVGQSTAARR
jgi:hypothetical protein